MNEPDKVEVLSMMINYGGSFASNLGRAWMSADIINNAKLHADFGELYKEYAAMAISNKTEAAK